MYTLAPAYIWWFVPVVGALILSIPLSVYSSRVSFGRRLRRAKLFLIPEEVALPDELRSAGAHVDDGDASGFLHAVVDPLANAIACVAAPPHAKNAPAVQVRRDRAIAAAVKQDPGAMTDRDKRLFLADRLALSQLHLWVRTSGAAHPGWYAEDSVSAMSDDAVLRRAS